MACDLTSARTEPCKDVVGGINKLWFVTYGDITAYTHGVVSGEILACRFVKLACQRHLDDLENGHGRGLYFDEDAADYALLFFSHLKLWKGAEYRGKEFVLGPHYKFILCCIMGWKNKDGTRRFRTAYIETAKKSAKSTFAGGLGAYFLIDDEYGAEIYTAAVKVKRRPLQIVQRRHLKLVHIFLLSRKSSSS